MITVKTKQNILSVLMYQGWKCRFSSLLLQSQLTLLVSWLPWGHLLCSGVMLE